MLNFKDWKLASSDGTKATLKHANGHEMTIAMKALPKIQREQILRLAKIQRYEEGSPGTVQSDSPQPSTPPQRAPDSTDTKDSDPVAGKGGIHFTINTGGSQPAQPPQQPPVAVPPAQNPAAVYGAKPVEVTAPNLPNAVHNLNSGGTMNPEAVAKNAQGAVSGQQLIDTAKSAAMAPIEQGYIRGATETQKTAQDLYNQMNNHSNEFANYVNEHEINPKAYTENMSSGKKVLSGLGLILGGIGAGKLGSTDNPALRFLNQQIDRDIAGQQARVNNQRTVLGAYQDLYGQGVAANNLTRASLLDIYAHKAQLLADQLGTPQAKVNAQQLGANAAIEKSKLLQDAAVNLSSLPGTRPTSSDEGAANVPRGMQTPGNMGQQGPASAQAAPPSSAPKMYVDASGKPVDSRSLMSAGASPTSTDEELADKGIYEKGKTPNEQNKSLTENPVEPLLGPGAEEKYRAMAYKPKIKDRYNEVSEQYKQAQQADKSLSHLNETYGNLIEATQKGGLSGRIHRTLNPHALAGLGTLAGGVAGSVLPVVGTLAGATAGGTAGEALGQAANSLTNTDTNRYYDSVRTNLIGTLKSALRGTDTGDTLIEKVVQENSPEYGDSPKTLKQKYKTIEDFVKLHANTSQIGELLNKKSR